MAPEDDYDAPRTTAGASRPSNRNTDRLNTDPHVKLCPGEVAR